MPEVFEEWVLLRVAGNVTPIGLWRRTDPTRMNSPTATAAPTTGAPRLASPVAPSPLSPRVHTVSPSFSRTGRYYYIIHVYYNMLPHSKQTGNTPLRWLQKATHGRRDRPEHHAKFTSFHAKDTITQLS